MSSQVLTTWPVLCGRRTFHDFQGTVSKGVHTNAEVDRPIIKENSRSFDSSFTKTHSQFLDDQHPKFVRCGLASANPRFS